MPFVESDLTFVFTGMKNVKVSASLKQKIQDRRSEFIKP